MINRRVFNQFLFAGLATGLPSSVWLRHALATLNGSLEKYDISAKLSQIDCPSFFLCGEYDEMTPATVQGFASKTAAAEFKVYKDASHTPHIEQRKEFMQDMRVFLAKSDA